MRSSQFSEYSPSENGSMFDESFGSNMGEEKNNSSGVVTTSAALETFFYVNSPVPNALNQRRKRKPSNFDELVTGAVDEMAREDVVTVQATELVEATGRTKRKCVTRSDQRIFIPIELGTLGTDVDSGLIQLNGPSQRGRPRDDESDEDEDDSVDHEEEQENENDENQENSEVNRIAEMVRLQRPRLTVESPFGFPYLTPESGSIGLSPLRLHSATGGPVVSPFSPSFTLMRGDHTSPGSDRSEIISPLLRRRSIHTDLASLSPEAMTFIPIPLTHTPQNSLTSRTSLLNQVDEDEESVETESDLDELNFDGFGFYDIDDDGRINGGHPI